MPLVVAAIKTGHDPIGKLPEAAFHRTLEQQLLCPRCDATYNLIVGYDDSVGRHFEEESRRHVLLLQKTIMMGHAYEHKVLHFETNGVVVTRYESPKTPAELAAEATVLAEREQADRRIKPLRPAMGRPKY